MLEGSMHGVKAAQAMGFGLELCRTFVKVRCH